MIPFLIKVNKASKTLIFVNSITCFIYSAIVRAVLQILLSPMNKPFIAFVHYILNRLLGFTTLTGYSLFYMVFCLDSKTILVKGSNSSYSSLYK